MASNRCFYSQRPKSPRVTWALDPEMGVNKHFENVSWDARGEFKFFFREGAPNFVTFSSAVFPAELVLSNLSTKNHSRGSRGMLPRKNFHNFHAV